MRYVESRFTLPTTNKPLDTVTYEIRVGLRCALCYKKFTDAQLRGEPGQKHTCQTEA